MSTKPFFKSEAPPIAQKPLADIVGVTLPSQRLSDTPWNFYRCSTCGEPWVTIDVDAGHPPIRLLCKDRPMRLLNGREGKSPNFCDGTMHSAMYPDPAKWPEKIPKVAQAEWYYPPRSERITIRRKNIRLFQYLVSGGLLQRPAKTTHRFPTITEEEHAKAATD